MKTIVAGNGRTGQLGIRVTFLDQKGRGLGDNQRRDHASHSQLHSPRASDRRRRRRRRPAARSVVSSRATGREGDRVQEHDRRERGCRAERRRARRRRRHDRRDRSDRSDPEELSECRCLRRPRQGDLPRTHQLPRAPDRDPAARLQRGLRLSELREAVGAAGQPAARRRSHADDGRRRARSDSHRHDDLRRERRRHRSLCRRAVEDAACAGCSRNRSATARTCPVRSRRKDSRKARRRASRRSCATRACSASAICSARGTARINGRISVFPGGGAHRDVVAGTAEGGARVRREARSRLHDSPESEHRRVPVHGEVPRPAAGGVSRQARLPRPAPVRRACALRRCRRDRAARQDRGRSFRTRPTWPRIAA